MRKNRFSIVIGSTIVAIFAYAISLIIIYLRNLNETGISTFSEFAALGDFFGGTLNPILTFGTIVLLIFSLKIQLDELELTRDELKGQLDEQKKSTEVQLKIAQISEKSLLLHSLASSLSEKKEELAEIMSIPVLTEEVVIGIDEDGDALKSLELQELLNYREAEGSLKYIFNKYIDGDYRALGFDVQLKAKIKEFLTSNDIVYDLLRDYLNNGGSIYIAKQVSYDFQRLCFVLQDSHDSYIAEKSLILLGKLQEYQRLYDEVS